MHKRIWKEEIGRAREGMLGHGRIWEDTVVEGIGGYRNIWKGMVGENGWVG